jgi:hypothetical protein
MSTEQKDTLTLPRKLGDRLFLFLFASFFAAFFALMSLVLRETRQTDWLESILHGLAVEMMFAFSIFSLLTVVWALFTPRWLESLMSHAFRKVLTIIAVVSTATVFTILYYSL